jgi:hypothetical protein
MPLRLTSPLPSCHVCGDVWLIRLEQGAVSELYAEAAELPEPNFKSPQQELKNE